MPIEKRSSKESVKRTPVQIFDGKTGNTGRSKTPSKKGLKSWFVKKSNDSKASKNGAALANGVAGGHHGNEIGNMVIGRPKNEKLSVDVGWIKARMLANGMKSFAELSRSVGIDKAMMSKSLSGDRVFAAKDVAKLANILRVSTDELMRRIGYEVSSRGVPIAGKITSDSRISTVTPKKGTVFSAPDAPPGSQALVAENLMGYDGAVFVYVPAADGKPVGLDVMGQLCVVEVDAHLTPFLGSLGKGAGKRSLVLHLFGSNSKLDVEHVHSASPISAIYFP